MKNDLKTKKMKANTIPIFFAVDDNYVPFLCVALRSLSDNSTSKYDYKIHILIDKLSDESKRSILNFEKENISISFVDVQDKLQKLCARLHMRDYYTKATYYRFFVPEMFPEYDRGLYLDCDIVINCDIAKLYNCFMGQNLIAAVTDEIITDIEVFADYSEKVLGISKNNYFNAGILVMNLKKMRQVGIEKQFVELLKKRTYRVAQDQDYLNVLCRDNIFYLDKKWNKTPMPDSNTSIIPYIVHYKINYKPWRYDNIPYAEHFWKYAEKTEFYGELKQVKQNYTKEEKERDSAQYNGLVALAKEEIANAENETQCLICESPLCMEAI